MKLNEDKHKMNDLNNNNNYYYDKKFNFDWKHIE